MKTYSVQVNLTFHAECPGDATPLEVERVVAENLQTGSGSPWVPLVMSGATISVAEPFPSVMGAGTDFMRELLDRLPPKRGAWETDE